MGKIEYATIEKRETPWGILYSPASGSRVYVYSFDSRSSLLNRLGDDGWELISESSKEMQFKRVVEEEKKDEPRATYEIPYTSRDEPQHNGDKYKYNDDTSEQLEAIHNKLENLENEIAKTKYIESILMALLQDLVEKLYPESKALAALKLEFEGVEKSEVKPNECKKEPVVIDPEIDAQTKKFADEHVEEQLDGYEDSDKSLELFTIIVGFSRLLPLQTIDSHHRYMIEALYRFYNKNPNDKIKDCYIRAINRMALYLSTPDTISQLNEIAKTSMTIEEATDAFFNIAIKQLAFEKDGTAPFVVNEMEEFLQIFVKQIKENPELSEDKDLTAKIRKYANHILQEYALNCGDLL